jgi:hypothetical protein
MAPWPSQVELESAAAFNQGGQNTLSITHKLSPVQEAELDVS